MSTRENLEREAHAASEKLQEAGASLKQQAREQVESAKEQAKSTAAAYAEQGVDVAASSLGDFADAVRKAADKLNERDQGLAARLVTQAADGLEQAASSISGTTMDDMMYSVQRFARQNPAAFVGVAVLAGIALGRFARASAERSSAARDYGYEPEYRGPSRQYSGEGIPAGGYTGSAGGAPQGSYAGAGRGPQGGYRPAAAGTASAGRPMTPGTGPASGRSSATPASSQTKK